MPLWTNWYTKPPIGTGINWSHPLAWGLVGAWVFNEGMGTTVYNAASGGTSNNGVFHGGPTWGSWSVRLGLQLIAASSQYFDCGVISALNGATKVSMLAIGNQQHNLGWSFLRSRNGKHNNLD